MLRRIRAVRRNDKGFTLTELLITIIILGVLAAIVVFAVGQFTDDGELTACKADKRTAQVAVDAYRAKVGTYPPTLEDVVPAYLRAVPASSKYTISYVQATGVVSGTRTTTPPTPC